jgi:hypothetical protein
MSDNPKQLAAMRPGWGDRWRSPCDGIRAMRRPSDSAPVVARPTSPTPSITVRPLR